MPTYMIANVALGPLPPWGDPATWNLGMVPNSPNADVELGTYKVDIGAGQAYTVGSLFIGSAQLNLEGTLTAVTDVDVGSHATLNLNGGTLSSPMISTGNGGLIIGSGIINGSVANYSHIDVDGSLVINGDVTQFGGISLNNFTSSSPRLELAGADSATIELVTGGLLQLDEPAAFTGSIDVGTVSAPTTTQGSTPPPASSTIVLEGVSAASVTNLSYAPQAGNGGGILTIQEGTTTQTLRFAGTLAQSSFALADASTGNSPALAVTVTALPAPPTVQIGALTPGTTGIITNGNNFAVQGVATLGATVSVTANGSASSPETYSAAFRAGSEGYSATVAPALTPGAQPVSFSVTATNSAGSAQASAALAVDLLPSPVNNVTTSDNSSFDVAQLFGQGYSLGFIPGTQAVQLTNGTLSVGTNTNQAVVQRLYRGLLLRSADPGGLVNFAQQLASGTSVVTIANALLASPEYAARSGGATDTAFVTQLYQNFLGRTPNQTELSGFLNALGNGTSRGLAAAEFATSNEAQVHLANFTANLWAPDANGSLVVQLYQTALGREPGQAETQGWVQQLLAGLSPQQFAQDIAASAEFGQDHNGQSPQAFVSSLYQAGLGRSPGSSELGGWVNQINAGATPAAIVLGIGKFGRGEWAVVTVGLTVCPGVPGRPWLRHPHRGRNRRQRCRGVVAPG